MIGREKDEGSWVVAKGKEDPRTGSGRKCSRYVVVLCNVRRGLLLVVLSLEVR